MEAFAVYGRKMRFVQTFLPPNLPRTERGYPEIKRFLLACLSSFMLVGAMTPVSADEADPVRVYPAAPGEPLSQQFVVKANDKTVPVYLATVLATDPARRRRTDLHQYYPGDLGQTSFASFDLRGKAQITVTYPGPINHVKLLPTSSGITPVVSGQNVTFTVSQPGQFVLEVNDDTVGCLQLFANPWDEQAPDPKDPNVIYYGPGIHKVTSVQVPSGKTVYVAADAVIYGTPDGPPGPIINLYGNDIKIRGRGIIDGSLCPHPMRAILGAEGHNISIEGVILRDSGSWTTPLTACDGVTIKNIKVIGFRGNSDGIDVNNCQNVDISGCYIRTNDDLIVVKTQLPGRGPSRHVTVEHCVLWNELAHALSLGAELREPVDDIHFSDCDIIHDKGRLWLLRIYNCDSCDANNVTFENIRIEECQRLISLWIGREIWTEDKEPGHIHNVTFRNIISPAPLQPSSPAEFVGFDAEHAINDVKLDHVVVAGNPITSNDVKQNEFVHGVVVTP
jgi:hypothetical protein